ncbi:MAG: hypothetical protein PHY54_02970 [Methylococcales bacterium]|nr:hypothetical protein [Methylococcales bacterium]
MKKTLMLLLTAIISTFGLPSVSAFAEAGLVDKVTPCAILQKLISLDKGNTFMETATIGVPHSAQYRFIVTNCGNVALSNGTITDASLGLSSVSIPGHGTLLPKTSVTITKNNEGFKSLDRPGQCLHPETFTNTAGFAATSTAGNIQVISNWTVLACTGATEIAIKKQISVDSGVTWLDADTISTAATALAPHEASYRLIITYSGKAELVNVEIDDLMLELFKVPVPGGASLAVGRQIIITSSDPGFANLSQPDRCLSPGVFPNIASVIGLTQNGQRVIASNPAFLICKK